MPANLTSEHHSSHHISVVGSPDDVDGIAPSAQCFEDSAPPAVSAPAPVALCLGCHKQPVEFESPVCGHLLYCRKCAMKVATGGKCKVCSQMFPDLRRAVLSK